MAPVGSVKEIVVGWDSEKESAAELGGKVHEEETARHGHAAG